MARAWRVSSLSAGLVLGVSAALAGCGGGTSAPASGSGSPSPTSAVSRSAGPAPRPPQLGSSVASWASLRASGRYRHLSVHHGRVVGFTRVFSPASTQVPAVDNLERSVLPADAMVVDQGVLANCEVLVFRLPEAHPIPQLGRQFGVRLYSGSGSAAFDPRHVTRAVVSSNTLLVS